VTVNLGFDDDTGSKLRPVVVVDCSNEMMLVLPLTSKTRSSPWNGEAELRDWAHSGLAQPSRTKPPRTLSTSIVLQHIGRVSQHDWRNALILLRRWERRCLR
jgi:hypothetical protein